MHQIPSLSYRIITQHHLAKKWGLRQRRIIKRPKRLGQSLDDPDQAPIWKMEIPCLRFEDEAEIFNKILKQLCWIGSSFYLAPTYLSVQASLRPIHQSPDYLPINFGSLNQRKRTFRIRSNTFLLLNDRKASHSSSISQENVSKTKHQGDV